MQYFNWSLEKNEQLKASRGLSFEQIVFMIESGHLLGIEEHPKRAGQKIYIVEIDGYAVVVPYVEKGDEIFLKTAFPSRKYARRYGLKEDE
ncbi:toxin [Desulfosudis oleivorans]|uniref:Toxin n=1 Tax=Desulfosudis oleivorans (strain DSM 6200 / JCM 39069 / Hxd3) TaxID=96561 RepID=A8ZXS9_DESOH|nr:toxin [Desulfosudis oleivorans]ABW68556.1 conserved hypothetical protein [Desulfosudis oleivorans Hxd3]